MRRELAAAVTSQREVSVTRVPPSSPATATTTGLNTRGITFIPSPGMILFLSSKNIILQTFHIKMFLGGNFLQTHLMCKFGENFFCKINMFFQIILVHVYVTYLTTP